MITYKIPLRKKDFISTFAIIKYNGCTVQPIGIYEKKRKACAPLPFIQVVIPH